MVEWPAEDGALYTLVLSNLDINTRENRSEFESLTQVTTFSWQDTRRVLALVGGQHTW